MGRGAASGQPSSNGRKDSDGRRRQGNRQVGALALDNSPEGLGVLDPRVTESHRPRGGG